LLQSILNIRASNIGHAIYYSVTGFDARTDIVLNALLELISENKTILKGFSGDTILPYLDKKIGKVRNLRNAIAHGSAQNLIIRNKTYVRWSPPAFDTIRVFRKIANRGIPGLSTEDIRRGRQPIYKIIDCLDALNRIAAAIYAKDETLPDRLLELEVGLTALRSLYSDGRAPAESKDQLGPSSQ